MSNNALDKKVAEEVKSKSSKLSEIIPELGFDIICRIVPGSIIVAVLYFLNNIKMSSITWQHVLIGVLFAYFVGSIIDYFCNCVLHWPSIVIGWRVIVNNAKPEEFT